MLLAFVGMTKENKLVAPSDRPFKIDHLARTLPQQAAERALLAAPRRRSLSIAQAA
jgi:hypothetical protein